MFEQNTLDSATQQINKPATDAPVVDTTPPSTTENDPDNAIDVLTSIYEEIVQFLPNILGALLILLLGILIIRLLTRFLRRLLKRTGVDKFADNTINKIDFLSSNNIRVVPSSLIAKILYYFLLLIVIVAATDFLQMPAVSALMSNAIAYIPSLVTALLLLLVGLFIADFVQDIALAALKSLNVPAAKFVASMIFCFILLNVLMLALEQAKINTSFITSNLSIILGGIVFAFAIGYGLASKDVMANHIGYFYNRKKIRIGDQVVIDDKAGTVIQIDNTSMTLLSEEKDRKIIIPLSNLNVSAVEIIDQTSG